MTVPPLRPGDPRRLGDYELLGVLGEGGQGVVYQGRAPSGELVAVKVLRGPVDEPLRERLRRELSAVRRVAMFCTAQVLDARTDDARPYVVSEYVAGPSLQQRVREQGPLTGGALERLAVGTASALAAIHAAGIVHRDFKPANVILGPDGPRVVDFGIARPVDTETATTGVVGTPAYLAPEQLNGQALPASDVFAWAGTMVFAATGRPAFPEREIPFLLHRIVTGEPDLSGVPESWLPLLRACLAKDPAARPTSQNLMVRLVNPAAEAVPTAHLTAPAERPEAARRGPRRAPALAAAGTALAVLAALLIWIVSRPDDPSGAKRPGTAGGTTTTSQPPAPGQTQGGQAGGPSSTARPQGDEFGHDERAEVPLPASWNGNWGGLIRGRVSGDDWSGEMGAGFSAGARLAEVVIFDEASPSEYECFTGNSAVTKADESTVELTLHCGDPKDDRVKVRARITRLSEDEARVRLRSPAYEADGYLRK
ncbi:serine/threonine-protein kinase [Bailinhaonella thermotolerans]|uniref:serine/threonine-protein kinase n=1 Tax=Bailinhaonella thermotolerans TaxID=1070861 RepID=UPI00192A3095|nr:serine/threonine-protein kinase [Bailinhaonella thermotolerans]